MRTAPSVALGEVEDLVALRRALAGDEVESGRSRRGAPCSCGRRAACPCFSSSTMFGSPAAATKVGNQSRPGHHPVLDLAGRHLARPAQDARHAEAAFHHGALAAGERRLSAVRPGEVLGAVVGRERRRWCCCRRPVSSSFCITAPTTSSSCAMPASSIDQPFSERAHLLVLLREMRDDVHARGVEPEEERLVGAAAPCR